MTLHTRDFERLFSEHPRLLDLLWASDCRQRQWTFVGDDGARLHHSRATLWRRRRPGEEPPNTTMGDIVVAVVDDDTDRRVDDDSGVRNPIIGNSNNPR
mmetsp:Transcript_19993/g.79750  ORF Transcript_19993/g.79750 Transcript_19993/m.79750 type:complete len:99 (+) Transcript_19993:644-940(+)